MSGDNDPFQASNVNVPTNTIEEWRQLADQMQPSQGAYSGKFSWGDTLKPGDITEAQDAQWLRRFNLTVYKAGAPAPVTTVKTFTPAETPAPTPQGMRRVSLRDDLPDTSKTTLDPVEVTAKPDQQPQSYPGIDLSNLRIDFSIKKSTSSSPNSLYARIYNLSPQTMAKVIEFTRIQVSAGYWFSSYGVIFDGSVVQFVRGKENPVDTFLDIYAGDGDTAFGSATMFRVFPAGSDVRTRFDAAFQEYQTAQSDLKRGQNDAASLNVKLQREYVAAGRVRSIAREMELGYNKQTYFDNGEWNVVDKDGYKQGEAVVLSPRTGMVKIPEVTQQGVQVTCLLNPRLRLGGLVHIDAQWLSGVPYIPGTAAQRDGQGNVTGGGTDASGQIIVSPALPGQQFVTAFTAPQGNYAIIMMNYHGDTRGQPWYCELVCIAIDSNGVVMGSVGSALNRASAETQSRLKLPPPATTVIPP